MRSLYQVLKASKIDPVSAPDMFTALWAKNISGGGSAPTEHEYTGAVPTPITANGEPLIEWILKGNLVQSSQPSAVVVNICPPIDDNSINRDYWGRWYDYEQYLPDEPCYNTSSQYKGLCNAIYVEAGTYTFSVYIKAEGNNNTAKLYAHGLSDFPNYEQRATVTETSGVQCNLTTAYQRYTFTFTATTDGYVYPRVEKTDDTGSNVIVTCYQVESGSTATPYIAYGKSVISPVYPSETGDRTENLFFFNSDTQIGTANYNATPTKNSSSFVINKSQSQSASSISIPLSISLKSGTYTIAVYGLKKVAGTSYDRIYIRDTNNIIVNFVQTGVPKSFTLSSETIITGIAIPADATSTYENDTVTVMIIEGSYTAETIPDYIPYGFKLPVQCGGVTTPVYTAEPLRKIGDYIDYKSESAEYRAVKKVVLTGNETPTVAGAVTDTNAYQFPNETSDYKRQPFICSHMVVNTSPTSTNTHGYIGQRLTLCFNKAMGLDTTTKVQQYLADQYSAGTPVTVWYVLATPTTESITAPDIPTTAGSQTFDVDTTLKPSEVYIKYKG